MNRLDELAKRDELMQKWFDIMNSRKALADTLHRNADKPFTYERMVMIGFSKAILKQAFIVRHEIMALNK